MAEEAVATQQAAETKPATAEPKAADAATAKPSAAEVKEAGGELNPNRTYTQDEVDKILAKVRKNERYRTKKEIEAYYQGRESATPRAQPQAKAEAAPEDKPPTRDQYESYEAFLDAKAEYTGRKAASEYRQKAEAEQKARAAQEAQAERIRTFQAKVNEKYPDLAERAEAIAHIEMPAGMGDAISESDFGPDILDHFANNPKDFERIAALSPSAAIREVGRLEARLEAQQKKPDPAQAPEPKKPSAAPAPIKPVAATAPTGDDEPSHDNPDAWKKWRDRQVARRKGLIK